MAIRYMGTKRLLAPAVRGLVDDLKPAGQVADLFAGMGSVASSLAPEYPVLVNDALEFPGAISRARFLDHRRPTVDSVLRSLVAAFLTTRAFRRQAIEERLHQERLAALDRVSLGKWMDAAPHVGNSADIAAAANGAARCSGVDHYRLCELYFSGSYFSTAQAVDLDVLRYAIDVSAGSKDWLLAAWLSTAARIVNAPGHTAQFLKPTSDRVHMRIVRQWHRDVWSVFCEELAALDQQGTQAWRQKNRVTTGDALSLIAANGLDGVSIVYADPPYTKDHYSRFYHVYETLFKYNYPSSSGNGRYPSGRFIGDFSIGSRVADALVSLFDGVRSMGGVLIISYPPDGLLSRTHSLPLGDLLASSGLQITRTLDIPHRHSTMGASKGSSAVSTVERIYVCRSR
jgi:adenine-specific DNA-methyltransferase